MKKTIIIIVLLIVSLYIYIRYITINDFKVSSDVITVENLPESFYNLKVVQFSDTLINDIYTIENLKSTINKINELKPDLVFFTGDLLDDTHNIDEVEKDEIISLLSSIETTLYKYAVYGDNDLAQTDKYKEIMDSSNFIILDNETVPLFYEGNTPITITGLTNTNDLELSYTSDVEAEINITLTHKPDTAKEIDSENVNTIIFAGHSQGGYINLPFIGPLIKIDGAKEYTKGNYDLKNSKLYISSGLGTENYYYRYFNTPEINYYVFETK